MSGIKWVFCMMHYCINIDRCALSGGVVSYLRIDWPAAAPAKLRAASPSPQLKPFSQETSPALLRRGGPMTSSGRRGKRKKNAVCVTFSKIH